MSIVNSDIETRICKDCFEEKPIDKFNFSVKTRVDGTTKRYYSYTCRNCRYEKYKARYPERFGTNKKNTCVANKKQERAILLDIKPFIKFLKEEMVKFKPIEIAHRMGISEDRINNLLRENQKYIPETTVDKYLTEYNEPFQLEALYPQLYEFK